MHLPSNFKNPHDEAHKMEETLIVIGGGVAGLSAGCYARMNGYSTTILEMAGTPGGLCTSWLRQAAADERFSQSRLLGKKEGETRQPFNPCDLSDQPAQVNIGVAEDFSTENGPVTYILSDCLKAAGREHNKITMHNKYYDPEAAPRGKSAITVFLDSDYLWWKEIAADPARYREEKERCADMVIHIIGRYHLDGGHAGPKTKGQPDKSTPSGRAAVCL